MSKNTNTLLRSNFTVRIYKKHEMFELNLNKTQN